MGFLVVPATLVGGLFFLMIVGSLMARRQARLAAEERDKNRLDEEQTWLLRGALPPVHTATYPNTDEMDVDLGRLYSLGYEIEGGPTQDDRGDWVVTLVRRRPIGTAPRRS